MGFFLFYADNAGIFGRIENHCQHIFTETDGCVLFIRKREPSVDDLERTGYLFFFFSVQIIDGKIGSFLVLITECYGFIEKSTKTIRKKRICRTFEFS